MNQISALLPPQPRKDSVRVAARVTEGWGPRYRPAAAAPFAAASATAITLASSAFSRSALHICNTLACQAHRETRQISAVITLHGSTTAVRRLPSHFPNTSKVVLGPFAYHNPHMQ